MSQPAAPASRGRHRKCTFSGPTPDLLLQAARISNAHGSESTLSPSRHAGSAVIYEGLCPSARSSDTVTVPASPASHSHAAATGTRGYLLGTFFTGRVGFGVGAVAYSGGSPVPTKKVFIDGAPPKHPGSQLCHRRAGLQRQPPPHPIHACLPALTRAGRQVPGGPIWAFPLFSGLKCSWGRVLPPAPALRPLHLLSFSVFQRTTGGALAHSDGTEVPAAPSLWAFTPPSPRPGTTEVAGGPIRPQLYGPPWGRARHEEVLGVFVARPLKLSPNARHHGPLLHP